MDIPNIKYSYLNLKIAFKKVVLEIHKAIKHYTI